MTVRNGPKVVKERHDTLDDAIAAMQRHVDEIRSEGTLPPVQAFRTYDPAVRVKARIEVTGPGRIRRPTAGVDVKGDGTVVPYRGEIFKQPLEARGGGSELDAVREALAR